MYHLVRPFRSYARRLFNAASFPSVSPTYCKRKSPISNGFSAKTPLPMRWETLLTLKPSWSKPLLIQKCAFSLGVNPRLRDLPFSMLALSSMRLLDSAMSSDLKTHILDVRQHMVFWEFAIGFTPHSLLSIQNITPVQLYYKSVIISSSHSVSHWRGYTPISLGGDPWRSVRAPQSAKITQSVNWSQIGA